MVKIGSWQRRKILFEENWEVDYITTRQKGKGPKNRSQEKGLLVLFWFDFQKIKDFFNFVSCETSYTFIQAYHNCRLLSVLPTALSSLNTMCMYVCQSVGRVVSAYGVCHIKLPLTTKRERETDWVQTAFHTEQSMKHLSAMSNTELPLRYI